MITDKRFGITPSQLKLLRDLRARGMAIAFLPQYATNGSNLQEIEQAMLRAGKDKHNELRSEDQWEIL
jgi:hypothetical protein